MGRRLQRSLFAVVLVVLFWPSTLEVQAQSESLPIEVFWEQLQEVRQSLINTDSLTEQERLDLAFKIDSITSVELPDGRVLPIDPGYLAGLLRNDPPDIERAAAILDEALALKNLRTVRVYNESDLAALSAILAGDTFQWAGPEPPNPLIVLWQRFLNWLARLLTQFAPGAGIGQLVNGVLVAVISIALIFLLRFVYVNTMRNIVREAEMDPMEGVPTNLTADQALARAQAFATSGNLRDAVRYLYLSALYRLEERDFIRLDRAHTNRELLKDLSSLPDLAARFKSVVETFDRVWYGFQPISGEEYGRYQQAVVELKGKGV